MFLKNKKMMTFLLRYKELLRNRSCRKDSFISAERWKFKVKKEKRKSDDINVRG